MCLIITILFLVMGIQNLINGYYNMATLQIYSDPQPNCTMYNTKNTGAEAWKSHNKRLNGLPLKRKPIS